jgi:hypothetical protein
MFETFWKKENKDGEPVGEEFAIEVGEAYENALSNEDINPLET